MRFLKRRLEQRLGSRRGRDVHRDGAADARAADCATLDRPSFARREIELNAPDQGKEREALYEAHMNMTGRRTPVATFCDAVVAFREPP